jgi:hypothetical protein
LDKDADEAGRVNKDKLVKIRAGRVNRGKPVKPRAGRELQRSTCLPDLSRATSSAPPARCCEK